MKTSFTDMVNLGLEARSLLDKKLGIISNIEPCEDNGNHYKKQRYDLYWFYFCHDVDNAKNILYTGTLDEIKAFLEGVRYAQAQAQGVNP